MTNVDVKNALLAGDPDGQDETREVPTHAGPVIVRGLTRAEVLRINAKFDPGTPEWEQHAVAAALVTPSMTPGEVETWQSVDKAGGALGPVTDAISELSGMSEGASKSGVPRARRKPRA